MKSFLQIRVIRESVVEAVISDQGMIEKLTGGSRKRPGSSK